MGLLPQPWSQEQLLCPRQPVQAIVKKSIRPQNNVVCLVEFWRCDSLEFVPNGNVVDADLYSQQLEQVHETLRRRYPALVKWNRVLLKRGNARPHTALTTMTKIQELGGIKLLPHPAYNSDLAPSDYHLFRSMAWKKLKYDSVRNQAS